MAVNNVISSSDVNVIVRVVRVYCAVQVDGTARSRQSRTAVRQRQTIVVVVQPRQSFVDVTTSPAVPCRRRRRREDFLKRRAVAGQSIIQSAARGRLVVIRRKSALRRRLDRRRSASAHRKLSRRLSAQEPVSRLAVACYQPRRCRQGIYHLVIMLHQRLS